MVAPCSSRESFLQAAVNDDRDEFILFLQRHVSTQLNAFYLFKQGRLCLNSHITNCLRFAIEFISQISM